MIYNGHMLPLQLPTLQNWSCHSCGGCCRQHEIEITEEERQRIISQGWTTADVPQPEVIVTSGPPWQRRHRLAHQPDGACVFLDEKGLCRIHAKFGEPAKPLACRIYPFAFHPAGKAITVSLRFSCPSVVANRGASIESHKAELRDIQSQVVPAGTERLPPPRLNATQQLDWPDTLQVVELLEAVFEADDVPFAVRLLRALHVMALLDRAQFDKIRGERLTELLQILGDDAVSEVPHDVAQLSPPGRTARMHFRLLAFQYARKDTFAKEQTGWLYRWKMFKASLRFTHGRTTIPPLQAPFQDVPFAALEEPFGVPQECEEVWTRYFLVKLQGLHFCGAAYYDVPVVEGFQSLALVFPVVMWLARWLAVSAGRKSLSPDDVARALAIADHHHGYSPAFGLSTFRARVRQLAQLNEIPRLVAWYAR